MNQNDNTMLHNTSIPDENHGEQIPMNNEQIPLPSEIYLHQEPIPVKTPQKNKPSWNRLLGISLLASHVMVLVLCSLILFTRIIPALNPPVSAADPTEDTSPITTVVDDQAAGMAPSAPADDTLLPPAEADESWRELLDITMADIDGGYNPYSGFGLNNNEEFVYWSLRLQTENHWSEIQEVQASWTDTVICINDSTSVDDIYDDYGWDAAKAGNTLWHTYNNYEDKNYLEIKLPDDPTIAGEQYIIVNGVKIGFTLVYMDGYTQGIGWNLSGDFTFSIADAEDYANIPAADATSASSLNFESADDEWQDLLDLTDVRVTCGYNEEAGFGLNDNGDEVYWNLTVNMTDDWQDIDVNEVYVSWTDKPIGITSLTNVGEKYDDYGWEAAKKGETLWRFYSDNDHNLSVMKVALPDDPDLEGEQYVLINGVKIEFYLLYDGSYTDGYGWSIGKYIVVSTAEKYDYVNIAKAPPSFTTDDDAWQEQLDILDVSIVGGANATAGFGYNDNDLFVYWVLSILTENNYSEIQDVQVSWTNDVICMNGNTHLEGLYPDYGWKEAKAGNTLWESDINYMLENSVEIKLPNDPSIAGRQYVIVNGVRIDFTLESLGNYSEGIGWDISGISISRG